MRLSNIFDIAANPRPEYSGIQKDLPLDSGVLYLSGHDVPVRAKLLGSILSHSPLCR